MGRDLKGPRLIGSKKRNANKGRLPPIFLIAFLRRHMPFYTPQLLRKVVGWSQQDFTAKAEISQAAPSLGHRRNGASRHQAMPLQQGDGCPRRGRQRTMCEGVPSGPGSFRELQNWQQAPPKQTQTMGTESSGQPLEPARVSPPCVSQHKSTSKAGIPPPTRVHQPCHEGQRSGSACSVDEVEGQLCPVPTEQDSVCEAPYILHVPVHNPLPKTREPDVFQNPASSGLEK